MTISKIRGTAVGVAVLVASTVAFLALPAWSSATLTEVGVIATTTPVTTPSCPSSPCLAVTQTTGFQVKVGTDRSVVTIPHAGTIVAWTATLGKPTAAQIKYFDENEGGASSADIAVLAPRTNIDLGYKLIAESPPVELEKYFGKTAEFPLEKTIPVKAGDVIGLSVPTWAPTLALNFTNTTSWRASRPKAGCTTTNSQTEQTEVGSVLQYFCLYQKARLTYSATLISTP